MTVGHNAVVAERKSSPGKAPGDDTDNGIPMRTVGETRRLSALGCQRNREK